MKAIRRTIRRAAWFVERFAHAWRLYSRLGFPWAQAWRTAGTWQ